MYDYRGPIPRTLFPCVISIHLGSSKSYRPGFARESSICSSVSIFKNVENYFIILIPLEVMSNENKYAFISIHIRSD